MKKVLSVLLVALLCATFISCSSSNDDEVSTDLNELNFAGTSGDVVVLSIHSNTNWIISGVPSWLKASSTNGTGNASVTFTTTSANNSSAERTADIFVQAGEASKSVHVRQEGLNVSNCDVTPNLMITLANDFACDFNCDEEVKYFYIARATSAWDDRMTEEEIIDKLKSDPDNRLSPNDDLVISFSGLTQKTNYYLYLIGFDKNGKHGNLTKTEIKTKSSTNQAQAFISSVQYNTTQWKWTTSVNAYSDHYYQFVACNVINSSNTYSKGIIAWYFKNQLDSKPSDFSPIKNGGAWTCPRNTNYVDIMTWAVDSNGELSGIVNRYTGTISGVSQNTAMASEGTTPQMCRARKADLMR